MEKVMDKDTHLMYDKIIKVQGREAMLYTIPDYYKEFTCTADKCKDTCCAGWQIVIDEKSLKKYKNTYKNLGLWPRKESSCTIDPRFGLKMLKSIHWMEGTFCQDENKRCAFLDKDNLCDLYKHLGEKSLCKTCRLYPRHIEEFEGLREITLSISCPEVARILMERQAPVTFLTYEKEGEEEFEDFDPFLFSILEDARTSMIAILQNRSLTISERALLILGMAHDMQVRINRQEMFDCTSVIEKYEKESALERVREHLSSGKDNCGKGDGIGSGEQKAVLHKELFEKLFELELLREDWNQLLLDTYEELFGGEAKDYDKLCKEFLEWKQENLDMDIHLEQLLVYFLFTYFPGAVYDGEVYAKVQMSVYCVWMIETLWMARWNRNNKALGFEEMTELMYRFSREVEHSDTNLKQVENWMEQKWFLNKNGISHKQKRNN
jgi:lysine-N-methylase